MEYKDKLAKINQLIDCIMLLCMSTYTFVCTSAQQLILQIIRTDLLTSSLAFHFWL